MPNTVRAADTGLPNFNRRSALAKAGLGIAAGLSLGTVSAAAAHDATISPELLHLIEAHRIAWNAYRASLTKYSEIEEAFFKAYPMRHRLSEADEEAHGEAFGLAESDREVGSMSDVEYDAALELCGYRCFTRREARLKAAYVLTLLPSVMKYTENDFFEVFLQSFCEEEA
jgi:hypothetical protein